MKKVWIKKICQPLRDLCCLALLILVFVFLLPLLQGLGDYVISEGAKVRLDELRRRHHWLTVLQ